MSLAGKKVGVLMESDFYEDEIFYYKHRFPEEGIELHFLTRLWGQTRITFHGHEYKVPFEVSESFEGMSDEELRSYAAIIVPSAIVSDRLRYTEDVNKLPPATEFLARAFAEQDIIKGIICHGMWLVAPMPELVRGRPVVAHNNLHGDVVQHGRDLHRPGRRDRRRPGDRANGRPLSPVRAGDHRDLDRRTAGTRPGIQDEGRRISSMTASSSTTWVWSARTWPPRSGSTRRISVSAGRGSRRSATETRSSS